MEKTLLSIALRLAITETERRIAKDVRELELQRKRARRLRLRVIA